MRQSRRWSIRTTGPVDRSLLTARPSPLPVTAAADAVLAHIRSAFPADCLIGRDCDRPLVLPPVLAGDAAYLAWVRNSGGTRQLSARHVMRRGHTCLALN